MQETTEAQAQAQPGQPTKAADAASAPVESKEPSKTWVARIVFTVLMLACLSGGVMLGLLGQPLIKAGRSAIVEIPNTILDLPDRNAIPVVVALLQRSAQHSIIGELDSPISRDLLESLRSAAKSKVAVKVTIPVDASTSYSLLRDAGVMVQQTPRVTGNWLALDEQILILSNVPLNPEMTERTVGRIVIIRGSLAQAYIARYRQPKY